MADLHWFLMVSLYHSSFIFKYPLLTADVELACAFQDNLIFFPRLMLLKICDTSGALVIFAKMHGAK